MAFVSDVKCGKCDRRYSGLRGRCPYCGTRRGKTGKHANQGGNTTGKLIVGLILILLLIAAVVFLIITGGDTFGKKNKDKPAEDKTGEKTEQNGGSIMGNDEDVTTVDGSEYVPAEQPEETGDDTETPAGDGEDGEMTAPEEMTFPWKGKVTNVSSSVNVRKGAGKTYEPVGFLNVGQEFDVVDQLKGESITDGGTSDIWYKIEFAAGGATVTGYLNSLYVAPKAE